MKYGHCIVDASSMPYRRLYHYQLINLCFIGNCIKSISFHFKSLCHTYDVPNAFLLSFFFLQDYSYISLRSKIMIYNYRCTFFQLTCETTMTGDNITLSYANNTFFSKETADDINMKVSLFNIYSL